MTKGRLSQPAFFLSPPPQASHRFRQALCQRLCLRLGQPHGTVAELRDHHHAFGQEVIGDLDLLADGTDY